MKRTAATLLTIAAATIGSLPRQGWDPRLVLRSLSLALLLTGFWIAGSAAPAAAQSPALTTVKDTVYRSDGTPATGTMVIAWQAFSSPESKPVFGGTKTVAVSNGALAVPLVPNAGAVPQGTSYNVRFYQSGGLSFEETWVVPTSSPVASPAAPTSITQSGTPGSTTYHYWVSATNASGETPLGPSRITTTSNATLNGTNYNVISWAAVSGATGYRVWRTTASTPPSGSGNYLVGSTASITLNDQSNTLQSAAVPGVNDTDPKPLSAVRVVAAPSTSVALAPSQVTGNAIVSNPSSTQTITAPSGSGIPLQIKGRSSNSSNVFEIYDNQATPQLKSWFSTAGALVSSQVTAKALHAVRMADQFPGADWAAKVFNAIADLPSTGGVVDACGFEGVQSSSAATLAITKPVTLLLCAATFSAPASGDTIQISSGAKVSILGAGQGKTVIRSAGSANAAVSVTGASTDVAIADLTVDGNSSGEFGIEVVGTSQRVRIENVECKGTAGVATSDCIRIGDGIADVQKVQVLNSWIHDWDNEGSGISIRRATDVEIAGNLLDGAGAGAGGQSAISSSAFQMKVHHNTIRGDFVNAISGFRGFENQIYENQIIETGAGMSAGIMLDSEYAPAVRGNTIRGAQHAISAETSPYTDISGNTIVRNREKAIYAWGRSAVDDTLIEDGEDVWNCSANATCATTAGPVGTNAARMTIAAGFTTGTVAYEDLGAPADASTYVYLRMWIRSDTELLDGVLSARLSSTAGLGTNTLTASVPKLHANTWQLVYLPMRVAGSMLSAINSVGLVANSDPGAVVIEVDDVQVETLAWKYRVSGNIIAESDCRACIDFAQMISDSDVSQNQLFDLGRFTQGPTGAIGIFLRDTAGPTGTIRVFQNLIRSEYGGSGEGGQTGIDNRGTDNYLAFNRVVGFPAAQAISDIGSGTAAIGNLTTDTDDDFNLSSGAVINLGTDTNLYRIGANLVGSDDDFEALAGGERVRLGAQGPGGQAGFRFGPGLDTNLYRSAASTLKTDDALVYADVATFANADTTPSVAGRNLFKTNNSGATTITALDDGAQGQKVIILCTEANTTLADSGALKLAGAFTCTADDTLTLVSDGSSWLELARSVN